ncbi:hypothetical protein NERG_02692 [Nematocida ausubeli]|uniref:Uncharacterized protein n=1 Tax=Nematocida ausubeli (strain ATCC PRA-371 / ERTm2) TaxID=1913371 RepID=H8ZGH1_NEMA1|nr:hypothetical protein NERG_02692 [Nematocida ausubeli]
MTDFVYCSCSLYIPGFGSSCLFCAWPLFFFYFLCFSCVCTENTLLFYYFYSGYTAVMHTHSACTRVSLINSLLHSPILSCLSLWPFCSSFYYSVYSYQYHLISLGTLCILPVFSLYTHSWVFLSFPVSDHFFSFIFLVFPVSVQRILYYFIILLFGLHSCYAHPQCMHTCLSYKLAYTLSYTLLSGTLAVLFILLLLCAHVQISLDFPWYTLYTARVLFIYAFLGLLVFSCV